MGFYDNVDMNVKTMYERCREYYNPEDFVIIMNIDTQPFTYQVQRPENVQILNPSAVTKELYYTKDPEIITLEPGQTRLAPAYEADYFIKQLTDKIILRNRGQIIAEGKVPQESAADPVTQHKYIQKIFQGKKDFMADYNRQMTADKANQAQDSAARALVAADLEDSAPSQPLPPGGETYEPEPTAGPTVRSVIEAAQA
jgi:hypothetical protein